MSKTIGPYRLNPRGDYNPAADPLYSLLDFVSDGGGSFVYINDTPSNEPTSSTSHWQQIAEKGDTGAKIVTAEWSGDDMLLTMDDESEVTIADAKLTLKGDPGDISNIKVDGATKTKAAGVVDLTSDFARYALWRKTTSGNPVSVYPVPESPLYPKVSGTFVQAGTGDPSPSNIRPITPWLANGASVSVVQTDGATISLTAPQEIPSGWMDNEGNGQVTWGKHVFDGSEEFTIENDSFGRLGFYFNLPALAKDYVASKFRISHYKNFDYAEYNVANSAPCVFFANKSIVVFTHENADFTITTVAQYKAYLAAQYATGTPVTLWYELDTPIDITPTASPLTALTQIDRATPRANVLTASTGQIELTYAKSPIKESDEIATAIAAL